MTFIQLITDTTIQEAGLIYLRGQFHDNQALILRV